MPDFSSLLKSGDFSDLQIKCNGKTFKVHKAIVTPHSEYFKRICSSSFKESRTEVIDLEDGWPVDVVNAALRFLYSGRYTESSSNGDSDSKAAFHIAVFKLADYLAIESLQRSAVLSFQTVFQAPPIERMIDWIHDAYGNTAKLKNPYRRAVAKIAYVQRSNLFRTEEKQELLDKYPEFAVDYASIALQHERRKNFMGEGQNTKTSWSSGSLSATTFGAELACPECRIRFKGEWLQEPGGNRMHLACPCCFAVNNAKAFSMKE
ncbi:MAG: hypothetical protein M1831_001856 [Alyxoria varia]|nr:MAG: hypothetical protein M1831_001856 [Alyxoria varia]